MKPLPKKLVINHAAALQNGAKTHTGTGSTASAALEQPTVKVGLGWGDNATALSQHPQLREIYGCGLDQPCKASAAPPAQHTHMTRTMLASGENLQLISGQRASPLG